MPASRITASAAGTWNLGDRPVNRMGFGTMRLTANPDRELAVRLLRRAVDLGVNHIDTAAFYFSPGGILGVGTGPARYATELIREALWPYTEDLVIATKVGPGVDPATGFHQATTAAQLRSQVEENLLRLGRDHLDLVNLRIIKRPGEDSVAERFGALAEIQETGLIRHLGMSNVRVDHHTEALRAVAQAHGATPHQVRLAWTLNQGPHVLAIPGTGDPGHLVENLAAGAIKLTSEELAALS